MREAADQKCGHVAGHSVEGQLEKTKLAFAFVKLITGQPNTVAFQCKRK